jgi:hypothetical protein
MTRVGFGRIIAALLFASMANAAPLSQDAEFLAVGDILANRDGATPYVYAVSNRSSGNTSQQPRGAGVKACKYYDDVKTVDQCVYHPYAKQYCEKPILNLCIRFASPQVIDVIREELIIEDQKARINRSTLARLNPGCATGEAVANYHKKVFAAHGIPEWCFPSWWLSIRGKGDK